VAAIRRPGTDSGPFNGPNIPASAFSKNDGFYLNAVDLALDKPMDESSWASGYHVELMLGPDGQPQQNSGGYVAVRQAYVTLRTPVGNGLDWKVGVFDTVIGYESTSSPLDPNYTRSYGYSIEPSTHTGVLATYKVSDVLTLAAGVADSSNIGPNPGPINGTSVYESQKTYMGTIAFTAPDSFGALKGATLAFGIINSVDSSLEAYGSGTKTSYYAGLTVPTPSNKVKLGAAFDYLNFNDKVSGANTKEDSVWVAGLFSTFQATDKVSLNLRGEIVDATQLGIDGLPASPNPLDLYYAGHYAGELTATVSYQIWANVLSRVEFRWDHVGGDAFGYSQDGTGNPNKKNDFLLALNLIYQF
jgi:hypothetical protein